ncbi:MAG: hypothetical protein HYV63_25610 [Candidatus Schekmanbacteria bacterium]|nr:hypothetical protein [Candidatus Schekmanbacteria bacterium]
MKKRLEANHYPARELSRFFPELTPPPGGLAALRRRLGSEEAGRHGRTWRGWRPLAMAAAMAVAAIAVAGAWRGVLTGVAPVPPVRAAAASMEALAQELGLRRPADVPAPVTVPATARHRSGALAVLRSDRVVFYRIAVLPHRDAAAAAGSDLPDSL